MGGGGGKCLGILCSDWTGLGAAMLTHWVSEVCGKRRHSAALEHREEPVTRPARDAKWLEAGAYLLLAERHLATQRARFKDYWLFKEGGRGGKMWRI